MRRRPYPPPNLGRAAEPGGAVWPGLFAPAAELGAWVEAEILSPDGQLHNPDHRHLEEADIAYLWCVTGYETKGRRVLGMCEEITTRGNKWAKWRAEDQLHEWFGRVPDFLITIAGDYAAACPDVEFCALIEHELYHVGHLHAAGAPLFTREGKPRLGIRGHDVEEFVGVVERYGVGPADGALSRLVKAAQDGARVAPGRISAACGLCALRAA